MRHTKFSRTDCFTQESTNTNHTLIVYITCPYSSHPQCITLQKRHRMHSSDTSNLVHDPARKHNSIPLTEYLENLLSLLHLKAHPLTNPCIHRRNKRLHVGGIVRKQWPINQLTQR